MIGLLVELCVTLNIGICYGDWLSETAVNSVADYSCPDGKYAVALYQYACVEVDGSTGKKATVVCQDGSTLTENDSYQAENVKLDRPLIEGDRLTIFAIPTQETRWMLSLLSGNDFALHMSAVFNHSGVVNVIIRNSKIDGIWGDVETTTVTFPYTVNIQFKTTIVVKQTQYQIFVDDLEVFEGFSFRVANASVSTIRLRGDLIIKAVIRH